MHLTSTYTPATKVNIWIPHPDDHRERISESIVRLLVGLASALNTPKVAINTSSPKMAAPSFEKGAQNAETGQIAEVLLNPNEPPIDVREAWSMLHRMVRNYQHLPSSNLAFDAPPRHILCMGVGEHGNLIQVI